jgi:hypothetical protein
MNDRCLPTGAEDDTRSPRLATSMPSGCRAWKLAPSVLMFCLAFALVMVRDWHKIATRDLRAWDESAASTVAANLTRRAFPPMVRINSLLDELGERKFSGSGMEGPYWQHKPPLFTYIPLPLFAVDGRVSLEMKRLAYAIVLLISGICFIVAVSQFEQSRLANAAAAFAAILWIRTPFTRGLISGTNFCASDTVLACTVVLCLWALLRYLEQPPADRIGYSTGKVALIGAIVALPVVAKSALGLIPATTFFVILLWDQKKLNLKLVISCLTFVGVIFCLFAPLYLSSPGTFRHEIGVPLRHMGNYQTWGRPWHFFVTNYLPNDYLGKQTFVIYAAFLFSLGLMLLDRLKGRSRTVMVVCGGWFAWNLIAVSAITTKAPNFVFQSYLPGLFFCIYGPARWLEMNAGPSRILENALAKLQRELKLVTVVLSVLTLVGFALLASRIHHSRTAPYAYKSAHELFYQFAEAEQARGVNTGDLFILDSSGEDCWFRYYILFLSGAEARTLSEVLAYDVAAKDVQAKYSKAHFVLPVSDTPPEIATARKIDVLNGYRILSFDTHDLKQDYTAILKSWVAAESQRPRLYRPDASCSWPPFVPIPN